MEENNQNNNNKSDYFGKFAVAVISTAVCVMLLYAVMLYNNPGNFKYIDEVKDVSTYTPYPTVSAEVIFPGQTGEPQATPQATVSDSAEPTVNASPSPTIKQAEFKETLKIGSEGDIVTELQQLLSTKGYSYDGPITGYFGEITSNSVKFFQEKNGLSQTGEVTKELMEMIRNAPVYNQ